MPRSDSGRVAARGWSKGRSWNHRCFVPNSRISGPKRVVGDFLNGRSHHPGAGRASARPSSAEDGTKNIQCPGAFQAASLWGNSTQDFARDAAGAVPLNPGLSASGLSGRRGQETGRPAHQVF